MDNLEGRFRAYDSALRKDAADECRLSENKAKLVFSAERKLHSFFRTRPISSFKILSTRIDNLEIKEDAVSGSLLFSGKVIADVSFADGKNEKKASIPVTVLDSQVEVIAKDVEDALSKATEPTVEISTSTPTSVVASLSDFKVVDDGSKYLKIYHTAAYGDLEPIGAISKQEYVTTADKGAILSEMFKDEAISWPADVSFTGTFTEPDVVEAIAAENIQYVVKADSTAIPTEVVTSSDLSWKYKVSDSMKLALEAENKNYDALQSRLTQRALSTFTDAWNARHLGNLKIKNTNTKYDNESGMGQVTIEAEVLDGKDVKLVPFTVGIKGTTMKLPDLSNLTSMLKDAKVINQDIPVESKQADPILKKKASAMAPTKQNYQEVLRLPKDFLPASLKVGDVIQVDGLRWKLSSKSEGQLSNQRDSASHWLFERVHGENDKPIYSQESY